MALAVPHHYLDKYIGWTIPPYNSLVWGNIIEQWVIGTDGNWKYQTLFC